MSYIDTSEPTSLAHEIRSQTPPIVVTITRPMRIELVGEELRVYRRSEESRRREEEEVAYRRKRQDELAMVCIGYIYVTYVYNTCDIYIIYMSYTIHMIYVYKRISYTY